MNKKTLAKALAVIFAVMITGCSSGNEPVETTAGTTSAEVTASVSETSAETTTSNETTTSAEIYDEKTADEEDTADKETYDGEALDELSVDFYDYALIEYCRPSHIDWEITSKAEEFLENSEFYSEAMANIAEYEANAELSEYIWDGKIYPNFRDGWQYDFDGDGSEEAFMLVDMPYKDYTSVRSFLIFSDKNGNMEILEDLGSLYPVIMLDYGGFKHIGIGGFGSCGAEDHTTLYCVTDSRAKQVYWIRGSFVKFGCFLTTYGWQGSGSTMYFDTEKQQYISISGEDVSLDELRKLDTNNITAEILPENDDNTEQYPISRFGSNYYVATRGIMDSGAVFIYEDGALKQLPDDYGLRISCDSNDDNNSVRNIDIDAALENMKDVSSEIPITYVKLDENAIAAMSSLDASDYGELYCDWKYDKSVLINSAEDFGSAEGGKEILSAAENAVRQSEEFQTADKIGQTAVLQDDGQFVYEISESRYTTEDDVVDENGHAKIVFRSGVIDDFDGDGKTESFVMMAFPFFEWLDNYQESVVFVNSEGEAKVICNGCGGALKPIRYRDFMHIYAEFGVNNMSSFANIYAVQNGEAVLKHENFSSGSKEGIAMLESMAQAPGCWLVVWDNADKAYKYVGSQKLPAEVAEAIFNSPVLDEINKMLVDDNSSEKKITTVKELAEQAVVYGGRYISIGTDEWQKVDLEYENGVIFLSNERIMDGVNEDVPTVTIDLNRAAMECI